MTDSESQNKEDFSASGDPSDDSAYETKQDTAFDEGQPIKDLPRVTRELFSFHPDKIPTGQVMQVCRALCYLSGGGQQGFSLYDAWIRQSKHHDMQEAEHAWDRYRTDRSPGRRPNERTIYDIAKQAKKDKPTLQDGKIYRIDSKQADQYEKKAAEWDWYPIVPKKELIVFAGDGGIGKSTMLYYIAAVRSVGALWPDNSKATTCESYLLAGEDDPETKVRGSLELMGADLPKIVIATPVVRADSVDENGEITEDDEPEPFTLIKHAHLIEAKFKSNPALGIVTIDPVTNCIDAGLSIGNALDTRKIIMRYARIAKESDATIIMSTHRPKSIGRDVLLSVLGSQAWLTAPRHVLMVLDDPEDSERHILFVNKSNIGPRQTLGIPYRIEIVDNHAKVVIESEFIGKDELQKMVVLKNE